MSSNVCWICGNAHAADEPCSEPSDQRVGTTVNQKYQINRILGEGGMGTVYEGQHLEIGRRVALKFLLPQFAANPEIVRRFVNEARTAGSLEHENIAAVHDFGRTPDGACYLVMDLLTGEDCAKLLEREGPLPVTRVIGIILQVCRGLDAAHRAGIVHRDLKPANLYLTKRADRSEWVRILDFGIAKLQPTDSQPVTVTGCTMGTLHYMSPEQACGDKSVDQRTDVYALGVILYELLSGKRPHEGTTLPEIVLSILHNEPPPLEALRPGLPHELASIVRKAMHREPQQRYATVADLGQALIPFAGAPVAPFRSQPLPAIPVDPYGETIQSGSAAPACADHTASTTAPVTPKTGAGASRSKPAKAGWLLGLGAVALVAIATGAMRLSRGNVGQTAMPHGPSSTPPLPVDSSVVETATASPAASSAAPAAPAASAQPQHPDITIAPVNNEAPSPANKGANKPSLPLSRSEKPKDKTVAAAPPAVAPPPATPPAAPPPQTPSPKAVDIQREPSF